MLGLNPLVALQSVYILLKHRQHHQQHLQLLGKRGIMTIRMLVMIMVSLVAMVSAHHPTMGGGSGHKGYSLGIRDSIMIAHSFEGAQFGPAQQMHGATYTVDAEFKTDALVEKSNWVVDIGAASEMLSDVLSKYNFKNLNELFPGENTTTEFMCKVIFDDLAAKCGKGFHGTLCIKLWESHKAWGCYEGTVGDVEEMEAHAEDACEADENET